MQIYINGNSFELADAEATINIEIALVQALPEKQLQQSFALALNGDFVGKDDYADTELVNNDSIDILFPIVGG
jgi:sulfur carrier protein